MPVRKSEQKFLRIVKTTGEFLFIPNDCVYDYGNYEKMARNFLYKIYTKIIKFYVKNRNLCYNDFMTLISIDTIRIEIFNNLNTIDLNSLMCCSFPVIFKIYQKNVNQHFVSLNHLYIICELCLIPYSERSDNTLKQTRPDFYNCEICCRNMHKSHLIEKKIINDVNSKKGNLVRLGNTNMLTKTKQNIYIKMCPFCINKNPITSKTNFSEIIKKYKVEDC